MARALLAIVLLGWWSFVRLAGGPRHHSYLHARWRLWQESTRLRHWLGLD